MSRLGLVWAAVMTAVGTCGAATYIWTGNGGDGRFSTLANWAGNPPALTENDTCIFTNPEGLAVSVDTPVTVGTLTFSGAGVVTLGGDVALTVTKITSGADAGAPIFNCPVAFSGGYLVEFETAPATFAGGATATYPDPATTDNEASHTLTGVVTFTANWTQDKIAYPYTVPDGSKLYGKHVTGTSIDATSGTNPNGLILAIAEGGYAEFDSVTVGHKVARISIRGHMKVNGIFKAGTDVAEGNSHVGFDGDEAYPAILEASGLLKGSHRQVYVKPAVLYIGKDGFGALEQDYSFHFDGCDKVIYATADFEIIGPFRSADPTDWGVVVDKAVTLNTQSHTVTWTGAAAGAGAFTKTGAGTLIMKPHGCNWSGQVTVAGGTLKIANIRGVGSSPVTVASGATLAFDNPDKTVIANEVAVADGATLAFTLSGGMIQGHLSHLSPPDSGTVRITVTGAPGLLGTVYPLTAGAALSTTDLARFALVDRNDLALSLSEDGDLILTVTSSDVTIKTFTYAAESSTEAVWSDSVAAWTLAGNAAKVAFEEGGNAIFAGDIPSSAATVSIPANITVGDVTIATPTSLTFTGAGTLGGMGTVTKTGTGTLTLDGANFDVQNIDIAAGKVVLGTNAGARSLGADSGTTGSKVTIRSGAQFNLNYIGEGTDAGANNTARADITQLKTFVIAGDGPDHRGAIINDALDGRDTHNAAWNSAFRRIELTDDATIGGIDRFDVRKHSGTVATAPGGIYGPEKQLTVTCLGWFGLIALPIDVGSVLVTDGGVFRPEEVPEASISIPGGITLHDGSLHGYNMTYPETVTVRTAGLGGAISAESGTTAFKGPVDVTAETELRLEGSATDDYRGGITNNGTVTVKGGRHAFSGGELVGDGSWIQTGGSLHFGGGFDLGSPRTVDISGGDGTFYYGWDGSASGALTRKVTVNNGSGTGALGFALGDSATVTPDTLEVNGNVKSLRMRMRNDPAVVGRLEGLKLAVVSDGFRVGVDGYPANYVLGEGTEISADNLWIGNSPDSPYSILTVAEGASLSVKNTFTVGDREGNGTYYDYRLVVDGGTVTQTGTSRLVLGYKSNASYVDFKSGLMDLYGIQCQSGWKSPASYVEKFTMDGGTLNIGKGGLCAWTHFEPFVQFNNGTVNCTTDWVVEQLRAVSFGDRAGGHVTFDIGDKSIDWRTGIIGAADVTLTGTGTFSSGTGVADYMRFQGAATGEWTIENTGLNDLCGASAFLGGLHLKEGISANIRIAGSNLVEAVFLQSGSGTFAEACGLSGAYPFACNDLTLLHAKGVVDDYDNANIMWQGQFYADTPGTWTFGGGYDDSVRIEVDGQTVMEHATWNTVNKGTVNLTVGWHDFRIVQYQAAGGWGTVPTGWANVMNVGFAKRSVDNTDAANYTRFDVDTLPLRAGPVTGAGGTVNWHVVHEKSDWATRTDWTYEAVTNSISMLDIYNVKLPETISNSTHLFDGWVFVPVTRSGDWQVYLDFDDRASLSIDGVDSGATGQNNDEGHNGAIPGVTPGWHRFELRVCDTGGNWGPWDGTTGQAKNPTAKITVNGTTYSFNEKQFRFSHLKPVEYAGLDGVIRLDADSTLSNMAADACPIWGTLTGTGTLHGLFAFAGEANALRVTGSGNARIVDSVQFESEDPAALAGLRKVEAIFAAKPGAAIYEIGPALGADPERIAVSVKDEAGNDYSDQFSVAVSNGLLLLKNASPSGSVVIIR